MKQEPEGIWLCTQCTHSSSIGKVNEFDFDNIQSMPFSFAII